MIYEYAIDPDLLIDWANNYSFSKNIADNFGLGKPRIMAEFPKLKMLRKKFKEAYTSPKACDMSKKRLEGLFDILTERTVKREKYNFNGELTWLQNAEHENQKEKPFKAILAQKNPRQKENVLCNEEIFSWPGINKYWLANISERIPKTAEAMASTVGSMLQNCKEFILIDPYFRPDDEKWMRTLRLLLHDFLKYKSIDSKNLRFEIHIAAEGKHVLSNEHIKQAFNKKKIRQLIPSNLCLTVKRWSEKAGREKIHDRFILTDIGGVLSTYGFMEDFDGAATTSLNLLSNKEYYEIYRKYLLSSEFKLEDSFSISSAN